MTWLIKRFDNPSAGVVAKDETTLTFETPALGDGFTFQVKVRCVRRAGGRGQDVWTGTKEERGKAHELLNAVIRRTCRRASAFSPDVAEEAANRAVADEFARHPTLRNRWTVQIQVGPSDEVRKLQRETQLGQQKIITEADADTIRLRKIDELSEGFLASAESRWIARCAVRLAQDPDAAAEVIAQMLNERHRLAEHLVTLVNEASAAHHRADIYNLVLASEGALRHALKQLGVQVPPPDTLSPLTMPEFAN